MLEKILLLWCIFKKNTIKYIPFGIFVYLCINMKDIMSKSDRTKQFIIEKTAHIFNAKGFAGTSLTDLTNATKLTKGSIYGNFENKDEVALAAFDYNFNEITNYIKNKILVNDNSIDRLLVYPKVYRDFLKIPFLKSGCPILNTSTEADDTHPLLKNRASNALLYWKTSIENQIKRGIQRNEIKTDTNPSEIAVILMSIIEGAIMIAKVTESDINLKTSMNYLESMILELKV
jgi:TetR/AcrR family transcriptional repressor of nem operon